MDIVLPPDFRDFLKLLNDKEVEYLLIGDYRVNLTVCQFLSLASIISK